MIAQGFDDGQSAAEVVMSIRSQVLRLSVVFAAVAVCAFANGQPGENHAYSAAGGAVDGPLLPPREDTCDAIVSWVDGQPVADWAVEIAKRDLAIERYLNDSDPERAKKYGFRSGQTPRLAWDWFQNNPIGFNGVPFVLLKTILDLDPNHENPTLRAIARIWKREAVVPARGATAPWTLDHMGVRPGPLDYSEGVARPINERQSPLP
jgi:hypothetical protein